jgi:hypothetical protein
MSDSRLINFRSQGERSLRRMLVLDNFVGYRCLNGCLWHVLTIEVLEGFDALVQCINVFNRIVAMRACRIQFR